MEALVQISDKFGKVLAPTVVLAIAMTPAHALAVTTWNWSYTTTISDQFASGTFTTADVVPTAGTTYQITGISGTYNRGGTAYTITGLGTFLPNQFRWDGTATSAILADRGTMGEGGFEFVVNDSNGNPKKGYVMNGSGSGFGPVTESYTQFSGSNGDITSSLLSPVSSVPSAPSDVPGPLPLLGAAAAFRASRPLRRRLSGPPQSV